MNETDYNKETDKLPMEVSKEPSTALEGVVLQSTGSWYVVKTDKGAVVQCRLRGKMRLAEVKTTNPVAVGDRVRLVMETDTEENTAQIEEVLARKNYIIRQSPRKKHYKHIIAANIDQAILIITFSQPRTSLGFIDRFLATAEMYHIPTLLVFNKIDIYRKKDHKKLEEAFITYSALNYPCLITSAITGQNMNDLKAAMKAKTSLLAGHSGVGKSTLINAISPGLDIRTKAVSKVTGKGMHTTTFATMHELDFGGYIIDTPGIREFGLVHLEPQELGHYFVEIKEHLSNCRFNNCLHKGEQDCAVFNSFMEGEIAESRYNSYLRILADIEDTNYWERN